MDRDKLKEAVGDVANLIVGHGHEMSKSHIKGCDYLLNLAQEILDGKWVEKEKLSKNGVCSVCGISEAYVEALEEGLDRVKPAKPVEPKVTKEPLCPVCYNGKSHCDCKPIPESSEPKCTCGGNLTFSKSTFPQYQPDCWICDSCGAEVSKPKRKSEPQIDEMALHKCIRNSVKEGTWAKDLARYLAENKRSWLK